MQESVTISHRGNRYEIGSGRGFYGIWLIENRSQVELWPQTPQGWQEAWSRFVAIEVPESIVAVSPGPPAPPPGPGPAVRDAVTGVPGVTGVRDGSAPRFAAGAPAFVPAALLVIGVVIGVIGLFPGYLGGTSLASESDQLVPHLIYLAGWAVSAALLLWRAAAWRPAVGALVAEGVSAVTFGLYFGDLGTVFADGSRFYGAGLLLSLIGWLLCAAGSVVAVLFARSGSPRRLKGRESVLVLALTAFAGLGAAIAFAPSWDSFRLTTPSGLDTTVTQGNAFSNPGWVIVGDVAVMAVLLAVVVVAALWQPIKLGAALLAGATIPLLAQAISAIVQIQTPASPLQFGITPAEAQRAGLTISSGLTPAFWVYCAFVVALLLIAARMLTSPAAEPSAHAPTGLVTAGVASEPGRTL